LSQESLLASTIFYIIKEFVQPKMSLNREFLIWKEQGRRCEREGEVGGWAGQKAVIFKVRFGKDRGDRQRYKDIERHRNKET
jgi:hypothetical protein